MHTAAASHAREVESVRGEVVEAQLRMKQDLIAVEAEKRALAEESVALLEAELRLETQWREKAEERAAGAAVAAATAAESAAASAAAAASGGYAGNGSRPAIVASTRQRVGAVVGAASSHHHQPPHQQRAHPQAPISSLQVKGRGTTEGGAPTVAAVAAAGAPVGVRGIAGVAITGRVGAIPSSASVGSR